MSLILKCTKESKCRWEHNTSYNLQHEFKIIDNTDFTNRKHATYNPNNKNQGWFSRFHYQICPKCVIINHIYSQNRTTQQLQLNSMDRGLPPTSPIGNNETYKSEQGNGSRHFGSHHKSPPMWSQAPPLITSTPKNWINATTITTNHQSHTSQSTNPNNNTITNTAAILGTHAKMVKN